MPIKERRRKEKEELRQQILEVAKDIASNDGWQNLTIRKICKEINYTAPVVYQYFESKEMILQSLRKDGFLQVFILFEAVNKKYKDPEKRLLEYALTWWNFAINNPEIYQVMFNLQGVICTQNDNNNILIHNNVMAYYHPAFSSISLKAKRSETFSIELTDNLIALIHGFISMKMANKIKSGEDKEIIIFKNAIKRFIQSINNLNNNK